MEVLCKKDTTLLVKGQMYEVHAVNKRIRNYELIVKIGDLFKAYSSNNFDLSNVKLENGYVSKEYKVYKNERYDWYINANNIKEGDYVIYRSGNHKKLIKDAIYKVEKIRVHKVTNYYSNVKIKIEGNPSFYSSYSFKKCSDSMKRKLNLDLIMGNVSEEEIFHDLNVGIREYYGDSYKKLLIDSILKSSIDDKRNKLSIVDWTVHRYGNKYDFKKEDLSDILKMTLEDILNLIEKKK